MLTENHLRASLRPIHTERVYTSVYVCRATHVTLIEIYLYGVQKVMLLLVINSLTDILSRTCIFSYSLSILF